MKISQILTNLSELEVKVFGLTSPLGEHDRDRLEAEFYRQNVKLLEPHWPGLPEAATPMERRDLVADLLTDRIKITYVLKDGRSPSLIGSASSAGFVLEADWREDYSDEEQEWLLEDLEGEMDFSLFDALTEQIDPALITVV